LKVETLNPIRCFKGRGTEVAIDHVASTAGTRAAICASAGNLGQALAYSCRLRGIPATVIAPVSANPLKLDRIRALGATVKLVDGDFDLARQAACDMAAMNGLCLIEDGANIDTCEGAATIGLEIARDAEALDAVVIALGGGAMASGVGFVLKRLAPQVKVVCVQPAGAPAMTLSWRAKRIVETERTDSIADGVAGRCPIPEVLGDLLETVDDALLVSEDEIVRGMRLLCEHAGIVVEPSAALGIAALLAFPTRFEGQRVATILCGSNVQLKDFRKWVLLE
jgi:threonine dehydratase